MGSWHKEPPDKGSSAALDPGDFQSMAEVLLSCKEILSVTRAVAEARGDTGVDLLNLKQISNRVFSVVVQEIPTSFLPFIGSYVDEYKRVLLDLQVAVESTSLTFDHASIVIRRLDSIVLDLERKATQVRLQVNQGPAGNAVQFFPNFYGIINGGTFTSIQNQPDTGTITLRDQYKKILQLQYFQVVLFSSADHRLQANILQLLGCSGKDHGGLPLAVFLPSRFVILNVALCLCHARERMPF